MSIEKGIGALYKKNYCQGDGSECARYMVTKKLGREKVPIYLYPNMFDRVLSLRIIGLNSQGI